MNHIFFLKDTNGVLDWLWEALGMLGEGLLRSVFYPICALIYKMIYYFYNVFEVLCNGQLLNSEQLSKLFGRVSLLLGMIMLFRVAFSFIQALIDPDTGLSDKEKGIPNVIKKVVIVIIMFGVSGYVFELTADIQALIIKDNVISKFLLPQKVDNESFGGALAANLFTTFYHVDPAVDPSKFPSTDITMGMTGGTGKYEATSTSRGVCAHDDKYINVLRLKIKEDNDFDYLKNLCLSAKGVYADENGEATGDDEFIIEFNFIFCLAVGIAVLWFLINYCLSVGIRVIQLTVLQVLSPIAFIGYLEPKSDNMFSKWLKVYISTYVDVFIRMGIISFVCYLCALIMEGWNDGTGVFWKSVGNPTGFTAKVIGIFMILALFQFAKKAPDLLKSIFPVGTSGLSLGIDKGNAKALSGVGAAAIGGVAGGLTSAISRGQTARIQGRPIGRAMLGGLLSGSARNAAKGLRGGIKNLPQNMAKQREIDNKYDEMVAGGGTTLGMLASKAGDVVGFTPGQYQSRQLAYNQQVQDAWDGMKTEWEKSDAYRAWNNAYQAALHSHDTASQKALDDDKNKIRDQWIKNAITGNTNAIAIDYDYEGGTGYYGFREDSSTTVGDGEIASYGRVKNLQSSTASMISTTGLKLNGNESFDTVETIKKASDAAANNINDIYAKGYYKHQAEDKAAGVTTSHKPVNFRDDKK